MGILTPIFCIVLALTAVAPPRPPVPPPPPPPARPGSEVKWFDFQPRKKLSDPSWGDYLSDIENHLDPSMGGRFRFEDKSTWAHETTHGIHAWLNNNLQKTRTNYHLYVGFNKAVKIKQPNFKISNVADMVPKSLQKSRYDLYLIKQQKGWNNEPIYLWDEWVAYCNGAQCGIELINKNLYKPSKNDSSWGVLEFSVYSTYVVMAQKRHDPSYDNKQMLQFLAWNLERSMRLYKEGQKLEVYNWDDDAYLRHLRTSVDAAEFRNFLINTYGAAWANEVFEFK